MFLEYITTNKPSRKLALDVLYMIKFRSKSRFLRKYFERKIYYKYNCEISHQAKIHSSVVFAHPIGIVIGSQVVIGKGCTIYQNVTLGSDFLSDNSMPKISDNVTVGDGAKLIGGIIVGEGATIGANAVVTKDVPAKSTVVGVNKILNKELLF